MQNITFFIGKQTGASKFDMENYFKDNLFIYLFICYIKFIYLFICYIKTHFNAISLNWSALCLIVEYCLITFI